MATNREYNEDFDHNVKVSFKAENIAKALLEELTHESFYSVRNDPAFYHIGDLITIDGKGWDVKDDGVINRSGNVFCEVRKHWNDGSTTDGWMLNGEYTYLVVLDQVGRNIYVLDFARLKKIYKTGIFKSNINMGDNRTDGYTISLYRCKKEGVLVYDAAYDYDEWIESYYVKEKREVV